MTRIDRHLWRRHLLAFVGLLGGLCLLYLLIDFADRSFAYSGPGWVGWVLWLYWNRLLKVAALLSPLASLLAAGLTLSTLRRNSEWVALLAAGLSPARLVAPLASSALALGALTAGFDDRLAVGAALEAERVSAEHFHLWGSYAAYFEPKRWARAGEAILHVGAPLAGGGSRDVSLLRLSAGFGLVERIDAAALRPDAAGRLVFERAKVRRFEGLRQSLTEVDQLRLELPAVSELFALAPGRPEMLSRGELLRQVSVRDTLGLSSGEQRYEASLRLANAFAGAAGVLGAAALALRPRRRGHVNAALVEGLAIGGLLWGCTALARSLALAGELPVELSAYLPALVVGGAGSLALWRETRAPAG